MDMQTWVVRLQEATKLRKAAELKAAEEAAARKARAEAAERALKEDTELLLQGLKWLLEEDNGRATTSELFAQLFGKTLSILERHGVKVTQRALLDNSREGFEMAQAAVDSLHDEHATVLKLLTVPTVKVASYQRPIEDFGLPAGAIDLTEKVTNSTKEVRK